MPPNKLCYHKYKSFDKRRFLKDVSNLPERTNYTEWENQFLKVLNKHGPLKSKVSTGNNKLFVTNAIMRRSALKKIANNLNDTSAIKLYKKTKK